MGEPPSPPLAAQSGRIGAGHPVLRFAEELLLLLIDKKTGQLASVPERSMRCALAGAVLMDLALEERIDTDLQHLFVVDPSPVGDDLLDSALALIDGGDLRDTAYWVERLAAPSMAERTRERALARLVERGILQRDPGGILSLALLVARARRYPAMDGEAGREVELRIMGALFNSDVPAPRDGMLISLVHACGFFEQLLSRAELADVRERIDLICRLDLIGRAVFEAVQRAGVPEVNLTLAAAGLSAAERARAVAAQPLADKGGLPLVGNAVGMAGDIGVFLARQYRELGAVFRVRAFSHHYTVLAGPEANLLLQQKGFRLFRSFTTHGGLADGLQAHRVITSMDGADHFALRRVMKRGYSSGYVQDRIKTVADIAAREVDSWPEGKPIRVWEIVQRMVANQIAVVSTGVAPGEYLEDVVFVMDRIINVRLTRRLPEIMLRTPSMRRAQERLDRLYRKVLEAHKVQPRSGQEAGRDGRPDFIDDLLDQHRDDPQFLAERDLKAACLGPYIVGLHTAASTVAFMLYMLLKHPGTLARARSEADALFAGEGATARKLRSIDVIHRVALETLRMHPVVKVVLREAVNTFEFGGHTIPSGTPCLIAATVPHTLPEYFPEPERFDIDRFAHGRLEHRAPGAYAPFGLGTHRCLGSGSFEAHSAVALATILHRLDLSLAPPSYRLKVNHAPTPRPDDGFKIKVSRRRRGQQRKGEC